MENNTGLPTGLSSQDIMRMAASPAGQQLIALLRRQGGSDFQKAMTNAASGNYADAKRAIESLMNDPQAQKLLKQLRG